MKASSIAALNLMLLLLMKSNTTRGREVYNDCDLWPFVVITSLTEPVNLHVICWNGGEDRGSKSQSTWPIGKFIFPRGESCLHFLNDKIKITFFFGRPLRIGKPKYLSRGKSSDFLMRNT